jgi:hypothetical protein
MSVTWICMGWELGCVGVRGLVGAYGQRRRRGGRAAGEGSGYERASAGP